MILLVGPANWEAQMLHLLSDRTTHSPHLNPQPRVLTSRGAMRDQLRGHNEWIEIVICANGPELTYMQQLAVETAQHINHYWVIRQAEYLDKQSKKR